jgi:CYTH domain-containing protein
VDEFLADNVGLLVAEIELNREDERFELPPWVGKEVTSEPIYYNANLTNHPFKNWLS